MMVILMMNMIMAGLIIVIYIFRICRIKGLSPGQQKLCLLYTDHMVHVGRGARSGIGDYFLPPQTVIIVYHAGHIATKC